MTESRKLAAILAADVAGYSRLTGADEERTLARLRALRSDLIDPTISVHHGRVVKRTGDGILIEFRSVVDAVRCAIEVQNGMVERNAGLPPERRIEFRVGIHLGDVVEESDGDLMGDGVNIAARLEGIAKPGTIYLSEDAYRQVRARLDLAVSDLGETQLKNIALPMRVYALEVGLPAQPQPMAPAPPSPRKRAPWVPIVAGIAVLIVIAAACAWYFLAGNKTAPVAANAPTTAQAPRLSIVVLPFTNASGDTSQDYLADVLTDQLTTYISRIPGSFVIARNTAFTYKGKPTDVKQIGKDLGVRYALEGSVQPTDKRIRTNAQLIDTETGAHLWAEEFDTDKTDLLRTQDEIVTRLARTVQIQLADVEAAKLRRAHPANPNAQELALRCQAALFNSGIFGKPAESGFHLCDQALEIDPNNVVALANLAPKLIVRISTIQSLDRRADLTRLDELVSRALENDPNNALAHAGKSWAFELQNRFEESRVEAERAIALNPSGMEAYIALCNLDYFSGHPEKMFECGDKLIRLSPRDPMLFEFLGARALAYFTLGKDDLAIEWIRKSLAINPNWEANYAFLAASLALTGHDAEAREALAQYLSMPGTRTKTIAAFKKNVNSDNPVYLAARERLYAGLREAGLPEDDEPRLSIVVLPFQNLSGDAKQDYLADVLTDELTTYISRIPGSFVIARNTAFTYKGKPTDVKTIGKDLGVRYALEGSVQPTDKRIRTNAQFIDTETGAHLWAEEFDTDKTDLLETEDEIVTRLARTLQLQLTEIEAARLAQTHPANSEAQEMALRCEAGVNSSGSIYGGKDTEAGFALCDKALEADPKNALALAFLSVKFGARVQGYMSTDRDGDLARSEDMAARALAIDPNNAYAFVGRAYALVARGRFEQAGIAAGRALTLAPSLIDAYPLQILVAIYTGDAEKAIATADKAMRLSPNDPTLFNFVSLKALGQFMLHEDEKAIDLFRRSNALNPSPSPNYLYMTAALALSGHETEAQETLKQYLAIPSVRTRSIAAWKARTFSTNPIYVAMRERAYDGLRKAGMPEE